MIHRVRLLVSHLGNGIDIQITVKEEKEVYRSNEYGNVCTEVLREACHLQWCSAVVLRGLMARSCSVTHSMRKSHLSNF